jgi:hypothetical protein
VFVLIWNGNFSIGFSKRPSQALQRSWVIKRVDVRPGWELAVESVLLEGSLATFSVRPSVCSVSSLGWTGMAAGVIELGQRLLLNWSKSLW